MSASAARSGDDAQLRYWREQLSGELPLLALPLDRPRPAAPTYRMTTYRAAPLADPAVLRGLERLATATGATLEVVALALARLLLHVYTGQDDVILGTAIAAAGAGAANQVALRCAVPADDRAPFAALVAAMATVHAEARRHGAYPFSQLVEHLGLARDPDRAPVFQCGVVYIDGRRSAAGLDGPLELVLRVSRGEGELGLEAAYAPELFDEATVARMLGVYAHLARQVAARPELELRELDLVPADQRALLLEHFQGAAEPAEPAEPADAATVTDLFAEAVRRFPDRPAVASGAESLTYAELDRRVLALARRLARRGVRPGEHVALQLEPSVELVIAMLAVLRAGAAFLPIDPDLPLDRVRYLLEDSGAWLSIGGPYAGIDVKPTIDRAVVSAIDATDPDSAPPPPLPVARARDGAYLIYTSGTTGAPKGVLVEHRSLVHYVRALRRRYAIDHTHTAALLTSCAFDLGYTALWPVLLSGGCVHLPPRATCEDPAAVARYLRAHRVTLLKVTPSLLGALLGAGALEGESGAALRLIITGGERVRPPDIEAICARLPDALVVNHYGPTETTIGITTHLVARAELAAFARRPVIGRPLGAARAYVASRSLQLLPLGAPGELVLAGPGVARGYHGRPELTRERFIPDPFAATGTRGTAYRSGDLARWLPDGTLELLGRIDRQVKLRGYRVEPGELEQVLLRRLEVAEAAVVVRPGAAGPILCAYYADRADRADRSPSELRARLAELLPAYLVPALLVALPALPRTANGKLDEARLPAPLPDPAAPPADPPRTETERVLHAVWAEVLGIEAAALGVSQNFFELGGHSLQLIQILAELDDRLGRTLSIPAFYREGTIRALAALLDAALAPLEARA